MLPTPLRIRVEAHRRIAVGWDAVALYLRHWLIGSYNASTYSLFVMENFTVMFAVGICCTAVAIVLVMPYEL